MSWSGKRVTVLGLGGFGGGVAAARFLAAQGARVTVTDTKTEADLRASVAALDGVPVRFVLGEHRQEDLVSADLVVKNPAIPPGSPWVEAALRAGVPVTSELVLGLERLEARYVMVTGSKGKSTTSALLGAMLGCEVAGNNERPLLDALPKLGSMVVLEVSSFMAEDLVRARAAGTRFRPPAAVVFTHLEPEHLNWHGTVEAYYGAKLSLLDLAPSVVLAPAHDPELVARVTARLAPSGPCGAELLLTSGARPPGGAVEVGVLDGHVCRGARRAPESRLDLVHLFSLASLRLLGDHNRENAVLAAATAHALGAEPAAIARAIEAFQPLPHRLETVAVSPGGVRFVNDSMATTPAATLAALASVPRPVVVLLGGSDKGHDFTELGRGVAGAAHAAVCLGAVREKVASAVEAAGGVVVRADGFDHAVELAVLRCPPGGTVLLSPGTASFDMFPNFKARGERFRELARAVCGPASLK